MRRACLVTRLLKGNSLRSKQAAVKDDERQPPVEEVYKALSMRDHVLLRPEMYIGSRHPEQTKLWVQDACTEVTVIPGMAKIFDEILVNVADNFTRMKGTTRETTHLDVTIDNNRIEVYNDGKGVDVQWHKEMGAYCPEVVFGHFRAGSNFDTDTVRVTGGRNGVGAKATNVMSKEFTVEIGDQAQQKHYTQLWTDSMNTTHKPEIVPYSGKDFTRITFVPLLSFFNLETLDNDHLMLFKSRLHDIAACCDGLKVTLNGEVIPVKSFRDFVEQKYLPNNKDVYFTTFEDTVNHLPWEVAVGIKNHDNVSFVNGINTNNGGSHVTVLTEKIVAAMQYKLFGKRKNSSQTLAIKDSITIFLKCQISNPEFSSQTKGRLTYPRPTDINITLPQDFIDDLCSKNDITDRIYENYENKTARDDAKQAKLRAKRVTLKKLDDAKYAGTEYGRQCRLILTEGDSAKTLALAGLSSVNRDLWGVLPLRGKLLNVTKNSTTKLEKNNVFTQVIKALGLSYDKTYETELERKSLRYGCVVMMCDQDSDGFHIKGLIANFLRTHWPALLKSWEFDRAANLKRKDSTSKKILQTLQEENTPMIETSFIKQILTPVIKATAKSNHKSLPIKWFFNESEFSKWYAGAADDVRRSYRFKYYKGLGTSSSEEGREYFSRLYDQKIPMLEDFRPLTTDDCDSFDLAFGDDVVERRRWLEMDKRPETPVETGTACYANLVHSSIYDYFHYSNKRSFPSVIDGLKFSQRKILFAAFHSLRGGKEVKVTQLGGTTLEVSGYHHAESSLFDSIIKMAQDFTGSGNNIPLLVGHGQFGTRLAGGTDSAAPRYLNVTLSPLARYIFPEQDESLMPRDTEEGKAVEPLTYVPVVPMALINGNSGIGTGHSTRLLPHDPLVICATMYNIVSSEENLKRELEAHAEREDLLNQQRALQAEQNAAIYRAFKEIDVDEVHAKAIRMLDALNLQKRNPHPTQGNKKPRSPPSLDSLITRCMNKERLKIVALLKSPSNEMLKINSDLKKLSLNLYPWYEHHNRPSCVNFVSQGVSKRVGKIQTITELPVGETTDSFKIKLDSLLDKRRIVRYDNYSNDVKVNFTVEHRESNRTHASMLIDRTLSRTLTCQQKLVTTDGVVKELTNEEMIFGDYFKTRMDLYEKRVARLRANNVKDIKDQEAMVAASELVAKHNFFTPEGVKLIKEELANMGHKMVDLRRFTMGALLSDSRTQHNAKLERLRNDAQLTALEHWAKDIKILASKYVQHMNIRRADIEERLEDKKFAKFRTFLLDE